MPGSVEAAQAGAQGPSTAPTAPAPGAMGLPLPAAADTKEAEAALHGVHIGSTEDLVADVQLPDPHQVSTPAAGSACSAERQTKAAGDSKAVQPQPQQVEPAPPITPEQEAAVAACCEQFVALYEQAFLSRAVQLVADVCRTEGVPEAAVAAALRARGLHLAQLQARAAEVQHGLAECASDDGWRLIQDGALRLLYRHTPGSTVHCFKATCLLPAPMEQPLSMAREFDLVTSWNTYITNSTILKTFCDMDLLVYASVWLPWPFAERDVLISAVADDHFQEQGVLAVSFASPPTTPTDVDLPAGADQRVHMFFTSGSCMTLTPVPAPAAVAVQGGSVAPGSASSGQQTKVCIVSNIETHVSSVPEAIISFVLKVFAPLMYRTVLGVLHASFDNPNDPLPRRLVQHHELYDTVRQRCADFLDGHPQ